MDSYEFECVCVCVCVFVGVYASEIRTKSHHDHGEHGLVGKSFAMKLQPIESLSICFCSIGLWILHESL